MDFVSRILWRLKWALVVMALVGPAMAYFAYKDMQRVQRVMNAGAPIEAVVEGGRSVTGRYGATYYFDLAWLDAHGQQQRQEIRVSDALAQRIVTGDTINTATVGIRYLPSETEAPVIIADDAPTELRQFQDQAWTGVWISLVGLIFAPLWFWLDHRTNRKAKNLDADIDATLAQMRARNPS